MRLLTFVSLVRVQQQELNMRFSFDIILSSANSPDGLYRIGYGESDSVRDVNNFLLHPPPVILKPKSVLEVREHGFLHSFTYVDEDLNRIYSCSKNLNISKFCEQVKECMENWMSDSPEIMMDVLANRVLRDKNLELAMKKSITYAIAEEIGIPDDVLKHLGTNDSQEAYVDHLDYLCNPRASKFLVYASDLVYNCLDDSPLSISGFWNISYVIMSTENASDTLRDYPDIIRNYFSNIDIMLSSVLLNQVIERE